MLAEPAAPDDLIAVDLQLRAPHYLWLFEAFQRYRLETGINFEWAVQQFQEMYPNIPVRRRLEETARDLIAIMAPIYAERARNVDAAPRRGKK